MKFKHEVLFRVTVDVNGRQEYTINTTDYDHLCQLIQQIMITYVLS